MDTIVFLIYTISLMSAAVCLWVKWDQTEDKHKVSALERRQKELEQQIETLSRERKKAGTKGLFME